MEERRYPVARGSGRPRPWHRRAGAAAAGQGGEGQTGESPRQGRQWGGRGQRDRAAGRIRRRGSAQRLAKQCWLGLMRGTPVAIAKPRAAAPPPRSQIAAVLRACRGAFIGIGLVSGIINLLMLTSSIFMM